LDKMEAVITVNYEGQWSKRRQRFGKNHRPGARSAPTMRGGEGLVQVDVHGINAEVTRPRLADDCVEVGTVAVEECTRLMHRISYGDDSPLKPAAAVRVRQHDGCHVRA